MNRINQRFRKPTFNHPRNLHAGTSWFCDYQVAPDQARKTLSAEGWRVAAHKPAVLGATAPFVDGLPVRELVLKHPSVRTGC